MSRLSNTSGVGAAVGGGGGSGGSGVFNTSTSQAGASSLPSGEPKAVTYGVFLLTKHGLHDDSRRIVLVRDDGLILLNGSSADDPNQPLYSKSTLPSSTTPPELSDFFRRAELRRHVPLAKIVSLDIRSQGCTIRLGIMREHDLVLSDAEAGYMSQFLMALDHAVRKAAVFVKGSKALGFVFDAEDMKLEKPKDYVTVQEKMERRARLKGFALGTHGVSAARPFTLYDWNATMLPLPPVIDVAAASSLEVAKSLADHVIIVLGHVYLHRPPELPAPADPADRVKLRVFALSRHQLFLLMPERGEIKYKGSLFGLKKIELIPSANSSKNNNLGNNNTNNSTNNNNSNSQNNNQQGSGTSTPTSLQAGSVGGNNNNNNNNNSSSNNSGAFPSSPSPPSSQLHQHQHGPTSDYVSPSLAGVLTSAGDSVASVLEQEKMVLHLEDPQVPQFILSFKRSRSVAPTADVTNSIKTVAASICSLFERQGYSLPLVESSRANQPQLARPSSTTGATSGTPPTSATPTSGNLAPVGNLDHHRVTKENQNQDQQQQQQASSLSTSSGGADRLSPRAAGTTQANTISSSFDVSDTSNNDSSATATPRSTQREENHQAPTTPRGSASSPPTSPLATNPAQYQNLDQRGAKEKQHQNDQPSASGSLGSNLQSQSGFGTKGQGSHIDSNDDDGNGDDEEQGEGEGEGRQGGRPLNLSPGGTPRAGSSSSSRNNFNSSNNAPISSPFLDADETNNSMAMTPRGGPEDEDGDFVAHDALPQGASASTLRMRTTQELETSKSIADFKKVHPSLQDFNNPAVLLVRKCLRLTSKLRWETRIVVVTQQQLILCASDKTVRRSIAIMDIKECIVTHHWQAAAVTLLVDDGHDCVLRAHRTAPKEHAMNHIAGLITELNPAIKLTRDISDSKLRLKQILSVGRNLQKGDSFVSPAVEVERIKSGLAPSPLQRRASSMMTANNNSLASPLQQPSPSLADTFVKDYPIKEKERLAGRIRLFYTNFYQEGLKTIDKSLPIVLSEYALTEKDVMSKMCAKYQVDPVKEELEAKAKGVFPDFLARLDTAGALATETSMVRLNRQNNNNQQQQQQGQQPLLVSGAPLVKDMSLAEKERVKRRVRLFYQNHNPAGLKTFDQNIETVLNSASYTEEYLFSRMYDKYRVDPAAEHDEATVAGVMAPATEATVSGTLTKLGRAHSSSPSPTRQRANSNAPLLTVSQHQKAVPIKEMPQAEKDRLRRRVRLFYQNHFQDGLKKFDQSIETVLNTATYSEEYLFTRMYQKYNVDSATENQQATSAGVMGSKTRSRPATPDRANISDPVSSSPRSHLDERKGVQQDREVSVSGEVNQWLSPEQPNRRQPEKQKSTANLIYSQVFEDNGLAVASESSSDKPTTVACRAIIFDARKQDYAKQQQQHQQQGKDLKLMNNRAITSSVSQSISFTLRNTTPVLGLKAAWNQELLQQQQQQQQVEGKSSSSSSSSSSPLLPEEIEDNLRATIYISALGVVADVPLSFFCRTFLPHVEVNTMKKLDFAHGEWEIVSEYSAWKVRTRASFM